MATVGVRKKFPFRFRSMFVLWCERTLNYGEKSLLRSRTAYRLYAGASYVLRCSTWVMF